MATKAMMIEWATPIAGRELKALETFASTVAYWTQLQENGKIEGFKTYGNLSGNMGVRSGFAIVEGSDDQIDQLAAADEWRNRFNEIVLVASNVELHTLETGDKVTERMQRYGVAVKKLG